MKQNNTGLCCFRDLLQTLVDSVKECSAEVKSVVTKVNETLQDGSVKSEEKLSECLAKSKFV